MKFRMIKYSHRSFNLMGTADFTTTSLISDNKQEREQRKIIWLKYLRKEMEHE